MNDERRARSDVEVMRAPTTADPDSEHLGMGEPVRRARALLLLVAMLMTVLLVLAVQFILVDADGIVFPFTRPAGNGAAYPDGIVGSLPELDFGPAPRAADQGDSAAFLRDAVCVIGVATASARTLRDRLYLRVRTYERLGQWLAFTRQGFVENDDAWNFAVFATEPLGLSGEMTYNVLFLRPHEPVLPHLPRLRRLVTDHCYMFGRDGAIRLAQTIAAGDCFTLQSWPQPLFSHRSRVASVSAGSPWLSGGDLGEPKLRQLADQVVSASGTPEQRVEAVRGFLEQNCRYTRLPPPVPYGQGPLPFFLLQSRAGHCQHYAAAAAFLLRAGGVPCRIAGGFLTSRVDKETGTYYVGIDAAHAWPEVLTTDGWAILEIGPRTVAVGEREAGAALEKLRLPAFAEMKARAAREAEAGADSSLFAEAARRRQRARERRPSREWAASPERFSAWRSRGDGLAGPPTAVAPDAVPGRDGAEGTAAAPRQWRALGRAALVILVVGVLWVGGLVRLLMQYTMLLWQSWVRRDRRRSERAHDSLKHAGGGDCRWPRRRTGGAIRGGAATFAGR